MLIAIATLIATTTAGVGPGDAQSKGPKPWCIAGGAYGRGSLDCTYWTFKQCTDSARGAGGTASRTRRSSGRAADSRRRAKGSVALRPGAVAGRQASACIAQLSREARACHGRALLVYFQAEPSFLAPAGRPASKKQQGGNHDQNLVLRHGGDTRRSGDARPGAGCRLQAGHRRDAGQSRSRRLADDEPHLRRAALQPAQSDQQEQCRPAAHGLVARPAERHAGIDADRLSRRHVSLRARRQHPGRRCHQRRSDLGIHSATIRRTSRRRRRATRASASTRT